MATLTETIVEKLLDAVDDPAELQCVLQEHGHSKGPLYLALAQATTQLVERLAELSTKCQEVREDYQRKQAAVQASEAKLADLDRRLSARTDELTALEQRVEQKKAVLDQAKVLHGLGFGLDELTRLYELLAQTAISQGAKTSQAIDLFFKMAEQYTGIVSLELEAKAAEADIKKAIAELERWQAEAKAAEAKTKARKVSIDITEKMLSKGVKEADIPRWNRILDKTDVTPEDLLKSLERFSSIEKLCRRRQEDVEQLEKQVQQLTSQVRALAEERQKVSSSIEAVRDQALAQVGFTSAKVQANLDALVAKAGEYDKLERQAKALQAELNLARAFTSSDPERWSQVDRITMRTMILGAWTWSQASPAHNPLMPAPPRGRLASSKYLVPMFQPRLEDILAWAIRGLFTDEEFKAINNINLVAVPSGKS